MLPPSRAPRPRPASLLQFFQPFRHLLLVLGRRQLLDGGLVGAEGPVAGEADQINATGRRGLQGVLAYVVLDRLVRLDISVRGPLADAEGPNVFCIQSLPVQDRL